MRSTALRLNTIQVNQLLLQGKPYRKLKGNPIAHLLRGMRKVKNA